MGPTLADLGVFLHRAGQPLLKARGPGQLRGRLGSEPARGHLPGGRQQMGVEVARIGARLVDRQVHGIVVMVRDFLGKGPRQGSALFDTELVR